jgi:predicted LPLAT superfamily acyltransferase
VIRNIVMGRVRPGVGIDEVERALQALREMRVDGVEFDLVAGVDLGLRDGNATFAITVDLADEEAYRAYDRDPEHNRIRAELFAPISESIDRVQFRLPG